MSVQKQTVNYNNADYFHCLNCDHEGDEEICCGQQAMAVHNELLISDRNGIYIPQMFYRNFDFKTWGLIKENYTQLDNPDDEWYWEAWSELTSDAKHTDKNGLKWYLEQDGDLWAKSYISFEECKE